MKLNCNDCKYNINGWCNKQDKILKQKSVCFDFKANDDFVRRLFAGSYDDYIEYMSDLVAIGFYKKVISKIDTNVVEYGKVLNSVFNDER